MGLLRSEEIIQKKIRMPGNISSAMRIMDKIGYLDEDSLEFIDLTQDDPEAIKSFTPMINRCEEMESKLQRFEKYCREFALPINHYTSIADFNRDLALDQSNRGISYNDYFDAVETEIYDEERKMIDLMDSYNKIKEELEIDIENKLALEKYNEITKQDSIRQNLLDSVININMSESNVIARRDSINSNSSKESSIVVLLGVVNASEDMKMKRLIFRAGYARIVSTFFDLIYPSDYRNTKLLGIEKKIFIIFYPHGEYLKKKLETICEILNCSMFNPPAPNRMQHVIESSNAKIRDQNNYLKEMGKSIKNFLKNKFGNVNNQPGKYEMYKLFLKKEKMIYTNLSKCILKEHFIDGEVWILSSLYEKVKVLLSGNDETISVTFIDVPDFGKPKPTYIPVNEFTYFFQQIINTYGVPRYGEINPGYFTIVTFPFLFGVMFGDIGHGLLLLLMASYLCLFASSIKADKASLLRNVLQYRYFLLLLSIFSVFCGFLYNDFLSIPLNLFGSCYNNNDYSISHSHDNDQPVIHLSQKEGCVYLFGLDPKWHNTSNQLAFVNSLKMKLSVIIGIIQMTFGICIKGLNDFHFGLYINLFFEFIPQIIFMSLLFSYMVFMIIFKWLQDWRGRLDKAPNIIVLMMNLFLNHGSVDDMPLWSTTDHNGVYIQEKIQRKNLTICILMIPLMLFIKPIVEYYRSRNHYYTQDAGLLNNEAYPESDHHLNNQSPNNNNKDHHAQHQKGFLDYFIIQLIHTIEFVLGTVSNTASYLRLWALSLAHGELSHVFIEKTFLDYVSNGDWQYGFNLINIFIGFFLFANITLLVLLFMDSLECALHTLRLHWVEFQDKFYKGDGIAFNPFSFKYLIKDD